MTQAKAKKITRATLRAFINKGRKENNLFVKQVSSFDGQVDGVMHMEDKGFTVALIDQEHPEHKMGVPGLWLVGGSRDYFSVFNDGKFEGISVYNCCGSSVIVRKI